MVTASNTFTQFNALLNGHGTLGVAVSGGGDSLALLQLLAEWGRRPLHVFTVDHRINPLSAQWTEAVAQHTQRLNLPFTALTWEGAKLATGLSAAARTARHALLADAVRANGIRVLCLAHTADDIAEAQAMRTAGSNVSIPRTWAPSPVWPQGRGVFLCRPLLSHRRAELREFLTDRSLAWIDDPSNDSPKSLRARTRKALAGAAPAAVPPSDQPSRAEVEILLYDPEGWADLGLLRFDAHRLGALPPDQAIRLLATAAVCTGGGDRLPRRDSVERILAQLPDGGTCTLSGARLRQADGLIHVVRDAGDIGRNPRPMISGVWDGRFEVYDAHGPVIASGTVRKGLNAADQTWLGTLPAALRTILPVVMAPEGPYLATPAHRTLRPGLYDTMEGWVLPRFLAAACRIRVESEL